MKTTPQDIEELLEQQAPPTAQHRDTVDLRFVVYRSLLDPDIVGITTVEDRYHNGQRHTEMRRGLYVEHPQELICSLRDAADQLEQLLATPGSA